jgi:hypothetical protein
MVTKPKIAVAKATRKPASPAAKIRKIAAKPAPEPATDAVLTELKALARELNKAAKGLNKKKRGGNPKDVATILGNVERMTAEAATKSLIEAESAKLIVTRLLESLGRDWSRKDIEASLKELGGHLTNIMVAQEFQDLAGQSIRHALKALVGAIIVTEGGGPTEEGRLSQNEVDSLLSDLMP